VAEVVVEQDTTFLRPEALSSPPVPTVDLETLAEIAQMSRAHTPVVEVAVLAKLASLSLVASPIPKAAMVAEAKITPPSLARRLEKTTEMEQRTLLAAVVVGYTTQSAITNPQAAALVVAVMEVLGVVQILSHLAHQKTVSRIQVVAAAGPETTVQVRRPVLVAPALSSSGTRYNSDCYGPLLPCNV